MIQIDEPPQVPACASCGSVLSWQYSAARRVWVAWVPLGDRQTMRVHGCKPLQDLRVWRDVRQGDPPNDDYRAAREQLRTSSEGEPT